MLGDFPLFIGRAHLGVSANHVGHHGDACSIGGGLRRIGIGLGRFDTALQGAEQVELVRRADADIADVGHRHFFRQQEGLAGLLQALGAHLHAAAPAARRFGLINLRARPRQAGRRHAQIGVGGHGLLHQLVESRVLVQAPPIGRHRCGHHRFAVDRQIALNIWTMDSRLFGQVIIRPDHLARRQQQT
ncbi:hypothetical protein D3C71_1252120 [compost metagenome]